MTAIYVGIDLTCLFKVNIAHVRYFKAEQLIGLKKGH